MNNAKIINIVKQLINDLILIPEGSFLMDLMHLPTAEDKNVNKGELPQHLIHVQPFLMSKFLVTQEQWEVVSHLSKVNIELKSHPSRSKGDNVPANNINWYQALEFCNRLSAFTGLNITLPSESQWEYACRANTTTPYYCGNNLTPELANYNKFKLTPVGIYPSNPWGLYDMCGNVEELCLDDYHPNYEGAPIDGSPWLDEDKEETLKVLRGGCYCSHLKNCRSAFRCAVHKSDCHAMFKGFRICCSI